MVDAGRVVIVGPPGVGKTSLLHAVLALDLDHRHGVSPMLHYDTKGFKATTHDTLTVELRRLAAAEVHVNHGDPFHAVWLVTVGPLAEYVVGAVKEAFEGIPIFIILNKCDRDWLTVDQVRGTFGLSMDYSVFLTVASVQHGPPKLLCEHERCRTDNIAITRAGQPGGCYTCRSEGCPNHNEETQLLESYGVPDLLRATSRRLPLVLPRVESVPVDERLGGMDRQADNIIIEHTAAAAGIAVFPVPNAVHLPNQASMVKRLAEAYGFRVSKEALFGFIKALVSVLPGGAMGLAVGYFVKFIPLIGSVTAVAIGSGVTCAIGRVARKVFRQAKRDAGPGGDVNVDNLLLRSVVEQREFFLRTLSKLSQNLD